LNEVDEIESIVDRGFAAELAVSVAAGETFARFEEMPLMVVVGGAEDGRTVRTDGNPVTVATGVEEPDLLYQHLLTTLAGSG
jgi:hypothetical protein